MSLGKRVSRITKAYINHHWERIEAILGEQEARASAEQELLETGRPTESAPAKSPTRPAESELSRAYRVLGLQEGADLNAVRHAYRDLSQRSDPNRFPEGTPERERAQQIHEHVERAYQTLLKHLDRSSERFRNLMTD
ncbi:MAG: J domain-containing protein [Fimbriimonadales bacterium]